MSDMARVPSAALLALLLSGLSSESSLPRVQANDNRSPAGRIERDTLRLDLAVRRAEWYPESPDGPHIMVEAWSEPGAAPTIPAPLIRVREGQPIRAMVRNALPDSTIHVIGLATQPSAIGDTLHIGPGDSAEARFRAGAPGTYIYRAVIGNDPDGRPSERETAGGAFVVDPTGGSPPDRVFVINLISVPLDSSRFRNALAINGRAWPHTERIGLTVGDTARWRVINGTTRGHPMHLHGFYFRVDAAGDGRSSAEVPAAQRRLGVTELMPAWTTRTFTWSPDRAGNWLFHCHLTAHVTPTSRLYEGPALPAHIHSGDPAEHMAGLVLGITVSGPGGSAVTPGAPVRQLDLHFLQGGPRGRMEQTFSYVLQDGSVPRPDSIRIPGSMLVVNQGAPVDVVIHNRARQPGGIHWHGIELESWSDGVAGWSGSGKTVAPMIAPGKTFRARLLLPRSGTFMYHTHMNDLEQITHGAAGPLIVLPPGERFDPSRDHVYLVQWNGEPPFLTPPALLVNGDSTASPPMELTAGVAHRFRLIQIGMAGTARVTMRRDTTLTDWRPLAKDGADLPAALRVSRQAAQVIAVGETYDFEFTPPGPGSYELAIAQILPPGFRGTIVPWRQRLVVR
jgi:FtsP/CotA-like multicopper oxidase with cupredoxin domain